MRTPTGSRHKDEKDHVCHMWSCLDLSFSAGFAAHGLDNCIFIGPDFIVINLQARVVPAANVNVVVVVLAHLLEIHDFIPADGGRICGKGNLVSQLDHQGPVRIYLPGESPFASNRIPSPDTPVKLVFIRKSSSLEPSMGRMASHRPWKNTRGASEPR